MTNKEEAFAQATPQLERKLRPFHNLQMKTLLEQKLDCYRKNHSQPIDYYSCFDRVERKVIQDMNIMKQWIENFNDDFTLCKFECQQKNKGNQCVLACGQQATEELIKNYQSYYKQRLQKRPQYKALLKQSKIQK